VWEGVLLLRRGGGGERGRGRGREKGGRGGGVGKNILKDKHFYKDPPPRPENGEWFPLF